MYDNNDEFGIDGYREDFSYVFSMNLITVKRYKRNKGEDNPSSGDFMGLSSTESNVEYIEDIQVNINSNNLRERDLVDAGRDMAGVRVLNCYVEYNCELNNGDIIVFKKDNLKSNVYAGEKFSVKIKDVGPIMGQFCYKNFEAYSIEDVDNIGDNI